MLGAWWRHGLIQVLAALIAWVFFAPLAAPMSWVGLQAVLALLLAGGLRLGRGAMLMHVGLMPLLWLLFSLHLPGWAYLLAFVLTLSVSRNTLLERVPLYRTSHDASAMLAQQIAARATVLDAGSGDGRLALALALARPDIQVTALENAWGSSLLAYCRWLLAGRPANLRLECANFWQEDWGRYDVVYVFLSPAPMPRVWTKFQQQGKVGGQLISNTFEIPGVDPARRVALSGRLQQALLFWCQDHGSE